MDMRGKIGCRQSGYSRRFIEGGGGMLEGRKEPSERRSMASLGSTLLDVRNREDYIPARAKERKMERWECIEEREDLYIRCL